jgi:hypothetical protein
MFTHQTTPWQRRAIRRTGKSKPFSQTKQPSKASLCGRKVKPKPRRAWCDAITRGTYARERLGALRPVAGELP